MPRLRRFFQLPPGERRFVLGAWLLLPLVSAGLRLFGFRNVVGYLKGRLPPGERCGDGAESRRLADRIAYLVQVAANHSFGNRNCLRRSITLWYLMKKAHLPADLRIGVRKPAGADLEAHAWVELAGEPLNDKAGVSSRFTPIQDVSVFIEAL